MDKACYCVACHKKVAVIKEGSMLIKGIVMLCSVCEVQRKASDLASKTQPNPDYMSMFSYLFGKK